MVRAKQDAQVGGLAQSHTSAQSTAALASTKVTPDPRAGRWMLSQAMESTAHGASSPPSSWAEGEGRPIAIRHHLLGGGGGVRNLQVRQWSSEQGRALFKVVTQPDFQAALISPRAFHCGPQGGKQGSEALCRWMKTAPSVLHSAGWESGEQLVSKVPRLPGCVWAGWGMRCPECWEAWGLRRCFLQSPWGRSQAADTHLRP